MSTSKRLTTRRRILRNPNKKGEFIPQAEFARALPFFFWRKLMDRYIYDGPVKEFDRVVAHNWHAETVASSEGKARSNLAYQFKKKMNKPARSKITLTGKVKIV